ncbi:TetR/AcrR family transcriptional regulator [Nakamurella multipartita]|jgi:AcrR family transcriptional regulator|uniref:Transcriptional regulator, TetR family n=1 Tax=Nakamurella multipartita (strain ATCC 700099 / DSM 44233 / CIP 104796 / JCM 9543 / NBRC 105858 / Y-104) TaxID=479431 RepID=C8XAC6_NAKMY|nr:TetR/AcrR family transcriptional regulator [Nakamurella multipartita]ACV77291.1 transcriptional regulator, TetR family [Nakamurella multipartita DSM 44233]
MGQALDERNARQAARTDARVQRRRRQILDAATEVMSTTGFHATSMQAVAERAGISVGLIYQYFGNKDELLVAVIVDILEDFRDQVPAAIAAAGEDPVDRFGAAFRICCQVVEAKREAVTLTYRESRTLPADGLERIKDLELQTAEPIRQAVADGIDAGVFRAVDARLVVHNVLLLAHAWALKHWNLARFLTLDQYIEQEWALLLASVSPRAQ